MKILFEDYNFNAATQQVTFNTTDVIGLEDLLIITNVTDNVIIYNFADPTKGGTISNNVLTLTYNTTGMSNTDKLQIFLDNTLTPASEESIQYLKKIVQLLTPLSIQDSNQRQRIAVEAMPTTTVTGTVTSNIGTGTLAAVTTVNQFAGVDIRFQFTDAARLTYAQGIRRNLQFS
jgi:hypothetical protein